MDEIKAIFRLRGPNVEKDEIEVGVDGLRVGRVDTDNNLVLKHSQLSRRHLHFIYRDGNFWVEDLNSSNGVWVNDLRIRPETPQPLKVGDVVRAGPFLFTLEEVSLPEPAEPEPPPTADEPAAQVSDSEPYMPSGPSADPPAYMSPSEQGEAAASGDVYTPGEAYQSPGRASGGNGVLRQLPDRPPDIPSDGSLPPVKVWGNGKYPEGIPQNASNWLYYLPAIYSEDDFMGRYLLVFESMWSPLMWLIDNFDMYLSPDVAPTEWLQWMASWFDLLLVSDLPLERQRAVMEQIGWLFLRRGTRVGLERLLELYFNVKPEIIEHTDLNCEFKVRLPLSRSEAAAELNKTVSGRDRQIADQLIASQKPAFTSYILEIT